MEPVKNGSERGNLNIFKLSLSSSGRPCHAKYQHYAEILFNILKQYGTLVLHIIR
jgi:hypothetical protein